MNNLNTEWQLDKYFYSGITDKKLESDLNLFKSKSNKFLEKYNLNSLVSLSKEDFLIFLEEEDELTKEINKIFVFLSLTQSLDTQNQEVQKIISKMEKIYSEFSEKFLFINEAYKQMGYESIISMSNMEMFFSFKNSLIRIANDLKHMLEENQEKVYIKLTNASSSGLREEFITSLEFEVDGKQMTEDEIRALRKSPNREIRQKAFESLAKVYNTKQNQIVLGNLYSTVCKESVANMELRNFKTVMSARNSSEEVSDEAVNTLLENNSYELYHKFLDIKAKILNIEKMNIFDVFAPITTEKSEEKFLFEDGWKLYCDTISQVDPSLLTFSQDMLEGGRISVFPKKGKSNGAYAQYSKFLPEFILLNWANTTKDVTTLAHELGHAFHGRLARKQKDCVFHAPLTLAETASIFNETLMFETLLDSINDKEQKRILICERLNDIFATISRQISYVSFEKKCHESFAKNEPLTYEDYNRMWLDETKKLFGDNILIDSKVVEYGWSSIPHIFETPFYCYTYAFGNIISLNLYQNYKNSINKEEFIEKYHRLLAAGGSDTPENLLNSIFNIKFDNNFYKIAYENIENLIKQLE